jgi:superfamily II DNA/RNA helicase
MMNNRNNGRFRGNKPSNKRRVSSKGKFGRSRIDVSLYINKNVVNKEELPFVPEHAFADFKVDDRLKKSISTKGYVCPTPIQDKAIPVGLLGRDIVGIANTGTGKTAAFLIPLINKSLLNKKEQTLIVAPTRELAVQIEDELKAFTNGLGIYSTCCVGGAPIGRQLHFLRYHNNFIIGTPGRIRDLIERKALDLSTFKTVVLDEADRMLDMGFIDDMRFMMSKMPKERHTLFFSATLSNDIEKLIKDFLNDPVRISVKTQDTSKNVEQDIVRVRDHSGDKIDVLHNLLSKEEFKKVLVFGRTKNGVEKLSDTLIKRGHKASSIHGNKNQSQRQRVLNDFKNDRSTILIATDVAARGLDIKDVSHVINYDIPETHDDYIHRIGRTGRGDKRGKALTFID